MAAALIDVRDLCVAYGDHPVLEHVNLRVEEGEFVAIVGRSGCGKSTLLNTLAGFIDHQGSVTVPASIGMVFQNYAVFPWLTVQDNVALGLMQLGSTERKEVTRQHLELIGLTAHAHKYPAQLSGGQVQRVALARALAPKPKVLFMDEPFGALDMFTRLRMQEWLLKLRETELSTVLFVTHHVEEAVLLSDRVIMMGNTGIIDQIAVPFARPRRSDLRFTPPFVDLHRRIVETMHAE